MSVCTMISGSYTRQNAKLVSGARKTRYLEQKKMNLLFKQDLVLYLLYPKKYHKNVLSSERESNFYGSLCHEGNPFSQTRVSRVAGNRCPSPQCPWVNWRDILYPFGSRQDADSSRAVLYINQDYYLGLLNPF